MLRAVDVTAGTRDFDSLIGPHVESGFRYAVSLLNDPDEARDAVQDAQIKAWRSLRQLRDPAQARTWFFSIVKNQCRSTMRKRWWSQGRNPLAGVRVAWREDAVARSLDIDTAMKTLPPDDRGILQLYFWQDMSLEEIARVLGISTGAARSRLYRAARKLRPNLTEDDLR